MDTQKEEIIKIQEESKVAIENLANKILEEKPKIHGTKSTKSSRNTDFENLFKKKLNFELGLKKKHKEKYTQRAIKRT